MQTELENLREENKVLKHNYAWLQKMLKQKTTDHETAIDEQEEFLYGKLETTREDLKKATKDLSEAKKGLALVNSEARYTGIDLAKSKTALAKSEKARAAIKQEPQTYKQSYGPDEVNMRNAYMISF